MYSNEIVELGSTIYVEVAAIEIVVQSWPASEITHQLGEDPKIERAEALQYLLFHPLKVTFGLTVGADNAAHPVRRLS